MIKKYLTSTFYKKRNLINKIIKRFKNVFLNKNKNKNKYNRYEFEKNYKIFLKLKKKKDLFRCYRWKIGVKVVIRNFEESQRYNWWRERNVNSESFSI